MPHLRVISFKMLTKNRMTVTIMIKTATGVNSSAVKPKLVLITLLKYKKVGTSQTVKAIQATSVIFTNA